MMVFEFLRKPMVMILINTAVLEVQSIHDQFQAFFNDKKYELTFNGQIIYLEHYLNDVYDPQLRRIYIEDTDIDDEIFIFQTAEQNEETYIYNSSESAPETYLGNNSESLSAIDFKVFVPIGMTYDETIMRARIDKYRMSGFNYHIVEL